MKTSGLSLPIRAQHALRVTPARVVGSLVFSALVAALGIWIWQLRNAGELPDVGDPFDVALARRPIAIADDDNAYVAYADAYRKFVEPSDELWRVVWPDDERDAFVWSSADARIRGSLGEYLAKNREALEIWRKGSERPDAVYYQPANGTFDSLLPLVNPVSLLARIALLEASRRIENGEMEQAWVWYRSVLRCSRLIGRHGFPVLRVRGAKLHALAAAHIARWAADRRVDARLLRQALDETQAADALTSPVSEMLKIEYLACLHELQEPTAVIRELHQPGSNPSWLARRAPPPVLFGLERFRLRAANDPEMSGRAIKILFANWLAQVDRLPSERARVAIEKPTLIYAADPTAPPAASAVSPERLSAAIDHTTLARLMYRHEMTRDAGPPLWSWDGNQPLAQERRRRAALTLILAAELYWREHGAPPSKARDVVGPYLEALPEGINADDPIPADVD